MMRLSRPWVVALLALSTLVIAPANAKLRGSAQQGAARADHARAHTHAKATTTAIDHFQAMIKTKAPWGMYDAFHWNSTSAKLCEASGSGKDAVSEGTITHGKIAGHGAKGHVTFISGSTSSKLFWPDGSIPHAFTMCSITRYTGGSNGGILMGTRSAWIHGHWEDGAGAVFYNNWITTWQEREGHN